MDELIYTIIAKEINGEASTEERALVSKWLAEDKSNQVLYDNLKEGWKKTDLVFATPEFNTAKAWDKISSRIQPATGSSKTVLLPSWLKYTLAAAAVMLIGLFAIRQYGDDTVTVVAENNNIEVTLPDNSHITLRQGSILEYPKKFDGKQRNVKLEGEAFFEVARNENSPFIVNAQSAEVKVLGTSFNVKCNDHRASVVVRTGKVQMTANKTKASVILTPGEKGSLENGMLKEQNVSIDNYMFWKTGVMSFTNMPLSDVLSEISELKDSSVVFDAGFPDTQKVQLVNISFTNQSLEEMITDLCMITQSKWHKKNATIIVSGK